MGHVKPNNFEDEQEAQKRLKNLIGTDNSSDEEELSDEDMKDRLQKFLRGEIKNDPRL